MSYALSSFRQGIAGGGKLDSARNLLAIVHEIVRLEIPVLNKPERSEWMSVSEGFFVDWDGNARNTLDPGGGYLCETDPVAKYVAITTKSGTLVHEGTFYKTLEDILKAGIKAPFVPGSHPWGRKEDGF